MAILPFGLLYLTDSEKTLKDFGVLIKDLRSIRAHFVFPANSEGVPFRHTLTSTLFFTVRLQCLDEI